ASVVYEAGSREKINDSKNCAASASTIYSDMPRKNRLIEGLRCGLPELSVAPLEAAGPPTSERKNPPKRGFAADSLGAASRIARSRASLCLLGFAVAGALVAVLGLGRLVVTSLVLSAIVSSQSMKS